MNRLMWSALAFGWLAVPVHAQDLKTYQNYDFVPGDKIVFEDDFIADPTGEFAPHWKLISGQAVVNTYHDRTAFMLIDGNYAKVEPRIKTEAYLSDPFTVEFDFYSHNAADAYRGLMVFLKTAGQEDKTLSFTSEISTGGLEHDLTGRYPGTNGPGDEFAFIDKWHHGAIVYKTGQLKCYIDQYRVLVVPDFGAAPTAIGFGGPSSADNPLGFNNVRIATGGGMNLIEKLTKDGRIVTHGILFGVNQSVVTPPSMGTISQIVKLLHENPALKLEVGGHTDADGDAAKNLTLSQARADAVMKVIADAGIDATRLTSKGYGATKPMDVNTTPEGKANNRRVEFTKIS